MTMIHVPDKEEAIRFFTDVKRALSTDPYSFQDVELDLKFADYMLKTLSGEWKPIDTIERIPNYLYEINKEGLVRDEITQEVIEAEFDIDYNRYLVKVIVDEQVFYINGPRLAELMFKEEVDS
jgi:hypothetical protein